MKNCPNCSSDVQTDYDVCWKCGFNFLTNVVDNLAKDDIAFSEDVKKDLNCLRCNLKMKFDGNVKLRSGLEMGLLGELGHLLTQRKVLETYRCLGCNKVEMFAR